MVVVAEDGRFGLVLSPSGLAAENVLEYAVLCKSPYLQSNPGLFEDRCVVS